MCTVPHTNYVYQCTCTECFRKKQNYALLSEAAKDCPELNEKLELDEVQIAQSNWSVLDCRKYGHFVKFDRETGKIILPSFGDIGRIYEMQEGLAQKNERNKMKLVKSDDLMNESEILEMDREVDERFIVYRAIFLNPDEKNERKFRRMSHLIRFLGNDDFHRSCMLTIELCEMMIQLESTFYDVCWKSRVFVSFPDGDPSVYATAGFLMIQRATKSCESFLNEMCHCVTVRLMNSPKCKAYIKSLRKILDHEIPLDVRSRKCIQFVDELLDRLLTWITLKIEEHGLVEEFIKRSDRVLLMNMFISTSKNKENINALDRVNYKSIEMIDKTEKVVEEYKVQKLYDGVTYRRCKNLVYDLNLLALEGRISHDVDLEEILIVGMNMEDISEQLSEQELEQETIVPQVEVQGEQKTGRKSRFGSAPLWGNK